MAVSSPVLPHPKSAHRDHEDKPAESSGNPTEGRQEALLVVSGRHLDLDRPARLKRSLELPSQAVDLLRRPHGRPVPFGSSERLGAAEFGHVLVYTIRVAEKTWKCACGHELIGDPSMQPFYCLAEPCSCPQCRNTSYDICMDCDRPIAGVADEADHNTGECGCPKSRTLCWRLWNDNVCCPQSPYLERNADASVQP